MDRNLPVVNDIYAPLTPWTRQEANAAVRRMYQPTGHMSIDEAAEKLGLSRAHVVVLCQRYGIGTKYTGRGVRLLSPQEFRILRDRPDGRKTRHQKLAA